MEGYPQLASLMGTYPILSIYRRFSVLNARNLLYLQAELVDLEQQLKDYTLEDIQSGDRERKLHARNWYFLSRVPDGGVSCAQWYTMLAIRGKLKEYNECLLQQRQLAAFSAPDPGNLAFLNSWLADPRQGNHTLEGLGGNLWRDDPKDLLVVAPNLVNDSFARLVQNRLLQYYHNIINVRFKAPSDVERQLYHYQEETVLRLADTIGTVVSALLPILAVVVLYCVQNMWARLGLVALFTVLFSLVLSWVATGKRIEVFAATAAFASVQVVFVGSTAV